MDAYSVYSYVCEAKTAEDCDGNQITACVSVSPPPIIDYAPDMFVVQVISLVQAHTRKGYHALRF